MSGSVRWVPNPTFEAELAQDAGVRAVLLERAHAALEAVQAAAPEGRSGGTRIRDSYEVDESVPAIISTSSFWALVEFGSVNNPPYAPLRRGLEAVGLTLTDDRKL